ncbi:MAG: CHAT domain-containing tetratricopeptide repeat protein [Chloroflexota bacterium]|nr:CHAT domain-containing tetratricopeptide repeat protein [Chloroflexota bacterium]
MNAGEPDPIALLDELAALPAGERLGRAAAAGELEAVLVQLGDASEQLAAFEIAKSLAATELVVALADEAGSSRARARGRRARAMALAYSGRFHDALATCAEAATIATAGDQVVEAARARLASVNALASLGRFDDAIAAGTCARQALLTAGEPALAARADVSIGATYDMQDDPARAVVHYDRARIGLVNDPIALAQLETNRGAALQGLDEFVAAEAAFLSAVESFAAAGLGWAAAIAEGNLAHLTARQGRLERALYHFERARRHLETDESPAQLARVLAEQAHVMTQLGMHDEAVTAYEQIVPQLDELGFSSEAATARFGLGQALGEIGRLAEAETALGEAAAAFGALGQPVTQARVAVARAALGRAAGHADEARILLTDALEVLAERPVDTVIARYQLARIALEAGELDAATNHLARAIPVAESLDLAPMLADLLHLRAFVAHAQGEPTAALRDLRSAVERVERVRGTLQAERFRAAFLGNRLEIYESLVAQLLNQADAAAVAEAFAVTEQAKSRALLDLVTGSLDLTTTAARDAADPAETILLAELARLRSELNWYYSRLDQGAEDGPVTVDAAWHEAIRGRERSLQELQERIAVGRGIAGLYAKPVDLATIQSLIPTDTALVEYFVTGDEVLAFVVFQGQTTVLRRLASQRELVEQARQIRFQISRAIAAGAGAIAGSRADRLQAEARRALGAVYETVMAPVLAIVSEATTLSLVPHGPLHTVPLNALWDGERYLIERFQMHYSPSASLLSHFGRGGERTNLGPAVVVGVPDELAPRIALEAERVAATLGASRVLLGAEATVARVIDAAASAGILHLACHGRFVSESPLASGLKLADGWLTAREVYNLRIGAGLVALSGCDTGRSVIGSGDELIGLMRGFFTAGASSVVMSLWTVNDDSTTDLMTAFYAEWRDGASAVAALRTAQLRGLDARRHPAFWAPFLLGGKLE